MERVVIDTDGAQIEVDAVLSERHSAQVEITKHPVEAGVSPADHARLLPLKLQMEAVVTNTPLSQVDRDFRGVFDGAASSGAPGSPGYAQRVMAELDKLKTDRKLINVATSLRLYRNVMLTGIEVPRDSKMVDAYRFTVTFEEVRLVNTDTAKLQVQVTAPPKRQPTKKIDQGKKVGEPVSEQLRSLAKKGLDAVGVTKPGAGVL